MFSTALPFCSNTDAAVTPVENIWFEEHSFQTVNDLTSMEVDLDKLMEWEEVSRGLDVTVGEAMVELNSEDTNIHDTPDQTRPPRPSKPNALTSLEVDLDELMESEGLDVTIGEAMVDPELSQLDVVAEGNEEIGMITNLCTERYYQSTERRLDLMSEEINDRKALILADVLPQEFCNLRMLSLGSNAISDTGTEALSKVLPQLTQLRELNLIKNHIGDKGAAALAMALPKMTQLRIIVIWNDGITTRGYKAIKDAAPITCMVDLGRYGH